MAQGYGEPGPPSREGGPDGWSPPRRVRPERREEPWAPGWGPAPEQAAPRAGYPYADDDTGLSDGFDPFPAQAYQPPPPPGASPWVGPPGDGDGFPSAAGPPPSGPPATTRPPFTLRQRGEIGRPAGGQPPRPREAGYPSGRRARGPAPEAGYPPPPNPGSPPRDPSYPPADPGFRSPDRGYAAHDAGYPPDVNYAPPGAAYPPSDAGYPARDASYPLYPPQEAGYPAREAGYPPQAAGYPPHDVAIPLADTGYPPRGRGYPDAGGGYPDAGGGFRSDAGNWDRPADDTGRWDDQLSRSDRSDGWRGAGVTDSRVRDPRIGPDRPDDTDWRALAGRPAAPARPIRSTGQMTRPTRMGEPSYAQRPGPIDGGPRNPAPPTATTVNRRPPLVPSQIAPPPRLPVRPAEPMVARRPDRHTGRKILVGALTVLVLAGGAYAAFRWNHDRKATIASIAGTPTATAPATLPNGDPIVSQATDPKPLTTAEVFGAATIPATGGATYTVAKSETVTCTAVTTEKIATLMTSLGCTQVVWAALTSADHTYVITAGIINMPDSKSAATARTALKSLIASGSGRFVSLAPTGAPTVSPVATHLGWDSRGHYLTYAVIGLANGEPISATDSRTAGIINDIVEKYLGVTVIGARETGPSPTPSN